MRAAVCLLACLSVGAAVADELPEWAYPVPPPRPAAAAAPPDAVQLRHLPGSRQQYTQAQLVDLFSAPDWYPDAHDAMPPVVANGRTPDVYACGYCHLPGGQGRPENAALAGLPAQYILYQLADYASGARRSAWPGPYVPSDLMIRNAQHVSDDEAAVAADYFSHQRLPPRLAVRERTRVPRSHVAGWLHVADAHSGEEPLGERLLEFAPDFARHEQRDSRMRYVAYVPPGSIARGRRLAREGADGAATACETCHGPALRGIGLTPPLAGRSPGYLLRQLLAFKAGTRHGDTGLPMQPVAAQLAVTQMIDAVAYAASLTP
ncbi:MAG: hypothetical protein RL684_1167 [Pseudomonadota bacterium]